MEEMSIQDHQLLLEKLLETVNCPVCFTILQPSVSQCVNGHVICGDCRPKVNSCPTCRESFSPYKSTLLNQILELFPHECKFKGCDEFVKSKDDHEKWCGFRPSRCKICEWQGCGKDILDHFKSSHRNIVVMGESNEGNFWKNFHPDQQCYNVFSPISAHGHFFWMHMTSNTGEQLFKKTFSLVPNGKIDNSFEIKFVLKNSKNMYVASTILTADSCLNPGKNDHSFSLHTSILQDFFDKDKNLVYRLYVNIVNKESK